MLLAWTLLPSFWPLLADPADWWWLCYAPVALLLVILLLSRPRRLGSLPPRIYVANMVQGAVLVITTAVPYPPLGWVAVLIAGLVVAQLLHALRRGRRPAIAE